MSVHYKKDGCKRRGDNSLWRLFARLPITWVLHLSDLHKGNRKIISNGLRKHWSSPRSWQAANSLQRIRRQRLKAMNT